MERSWPHTLISAAFFITFAFYLSCSPPVMNDPDVAWHLAAGDWMRDHRAIPTENLWTFHTNNPAWINLSWLWDVKMSFINAWFGFDGLQVFSALGAAWVVAMAAFVLLRQPSKPREDVIKIVLLLVMAGIYPSISARPQTATLFFTLCSIGLLDASRNKHSTKLRVWLMVLAAFWANVHGGFVALFVCFAAYMLEALVAKNRAWLKWLAVSAVGCAAAVCVNPYGLRVYEGVLRTLHSDITQHIEEWAPYHFGQNHAFDLLVLLMVAAPCYYAKRAAVAHRALAVIWLLMAFASQRYFSVLAVAMAPAMLMWLDEKLATSKTPQDKTLLKNSPRSRMMWGVASVSLVIAAFGATQAEGIYSKRYAIRAKKIPTMALAYAQENYPEIRFLNSYDIGGFATYFAPDFKLFIDGRAGTAYTEEVMKDYIAFNFLEADWPQRMVKYDIGGIISTNDMPFVKVYESGGYRDTWQRVYRDKVASVLLRRNYHAPMVPMAACDAPLAAL